jgi:nitroreductase
MTTPNEILSQDINQTLDLNIFHIMQNRRTQRVFLDREVEWWKVEIILAAADTAPTAGGFKDLRYIK